MADTQDTNATATSEQAMSNSSLAGDGLKRSRNEQDDHVDRPVIKKPKLSKHEDEEQQLAHRTGIVYDVRMRFHQQPLVASEKDGIHPEDPRRITAIFQALKLAGLAYDNEDAMEEGSTADMERFFPQRVPARTLTDEEVLRVHTQDHLDFVKSLASHSNKELSTIQQHPDIDPESVYFCSNSEPAASLAAGGTIELCRAVMSGKLRNGYAIVRPPGHHAEHDECKGFCIYNNVSIAAEALRHEFKDSCHRILIVDWDIHHGNGIQQHHYEDPNVLYVSLHRYDWLKNGGEGSSFYPEGSYRRDEDGRPDYGGHTKVGAGDGLGRNVNIPWREAGMGDGDYIYAFEQVLMPIAREFNPDIVLVSSGFDAATGDMLGGCNVSPAGYAHMTNMLQSLAEGKVVVILEGGYNLLSISLSSVAVVKSLVGQRLPRLPHTLPSITGVDDVQNVIRAQSQYWEGLTPRVKHIPRAELGTNLQTALRQWRAERLFKDHGMIPLYTHTAKDPENRYEYTDLVLGTSNMDQRPLLVLLHDPPQITSIPDPVDGQVKAENAWLVSNDLKKEDDKAVFAAINHANTVTFQLDETTTYIKSAIELGFAVIDVTRPARGVTSKVRRPKRGKKDPKRNADPSKIDFALAQKGRLEDEVAEMTELLQYLFHNYMEPYDYSHVFFMGVETGHLSVTNFLKNNPRVARLSIDGSVHFVKDVNLDSVRSAEDDFVSLWYRSHSHVYVSSKHSFWKSEYANKPKRKFGTLHRSDPFAFDQPRLELSNEQGKKKVAQPADTRPSESSVHAMLRSHHDEVIEYFSEATSEWREQQAKDASQEDEGLEGDVAAESL